MVTTHCHSNASGMPARSPFFQSHQVVDRVLLKRGAIAHIAEYAMVEVELLEVR